MTAADTPSREQVLFALMEAHRNFMATGANRRSEERWDDMTDAVIELYRLAIVAAKPADDGVREATIAECARAAHVEWFAGNRHRYPSELGPAIEAKILALSQKAKP
jgi:hypothetical protein